MGNVKRLTLFILVNLLLITGCAQSSSTAEEEIELTISAAASMTDSLTEIKEAFEEENPQVKITYNFGGSGTLRKQIEQGAPIDLFFSASKKDYQLLEDAGLVKDGTAIVENELVLIKPEEEKIMSLEKFLQSDEKIAIGTPVAVPVGTYSQQVLQEMGVWEQLQDRIVFMKDVRQVLTVVKEGAVNFGMVYATDLYEELNITIVDEIDSDLHSPIDYFVATIGIDQDAEKEQAVRTFYEYVQGEDSRIIFEKYGFQTSEKVVKE
jgi:molybdate transport system substrate-binding protein